MDLYLFHGWMESENLKIIETVVSVKHVWFEDVPSLSKTSICSDCLDDVGWWVVEMKIMRLGK